MINNAKVNFIISKESLTDILLIGNHKFYPNGKVVDYPYSSSIDGGTMHSVTLVLNYSFNQYINTPT